MSLKKNSKQERFEKLKEIIAYEPQVTMAKISKMLDVSEATIKSVEFSLDKTTAPRL